MTMGPETWKVSEIERGIEDLVALSKRMWLGVDEVAITEPGLSLRARRAMEAPRCGTIGRAAPKERDHWTSETLGGWQGSMPWAFMTVGAVRRG